MTAIALIALVGVGFAALLVSALCRMAAEQDRAARRAEKKLYPHSDVTVTRS